MSGPKTAPDGDAPAPVRGGGVGAAGGSAAIDRDAVHEMLRVAQGRSLSGTALEIGLGAGDLHGRLRGVFSQVVVLDGRPSDVVDMLPRLPADARSLVIAGAPSDPRTRLMVEQRCGQVDALLLATDRPYEALVSVYLAYRDLVRTGGLIAFHGAGPLESSQPVATFLAQLRQGGFDGRRHDVIDVVAPGRGVSYEIAGNDACQPAVFEPGHGDGPAASSSAPSTRWPPPPPPRLIATDYHGFNLVHYDRRWYAVAQPLGALDLATQDLTPFLIDDRVLVAESPDRLKALVDRALRVTELERLVAEHVGAAQALARQLDRAQELLAERSAAAAALAGQLERAEAQRAGQAAEHLAAAHALARQLERAREQLVERSAAAAALTERLGSSTLAHQADVARLRAVEQHLQQARDEVATTRAQVSSLEARLEEQATIVAALEQQARGQAAATAAVVAEAATLRGRLRGATDALELLEGESREMRGWIGTLQQTLADRIAAASRRRWFGLRRR
jgi:hypothetical protein